MFLSFLDGILYYKDPSLPQLSNLAYLYIACLLSSFLIASDSVGFLKQKKSKPARMPDFTSVSCIPPLMHHEVDARPRLL